MESAVPAYLVRWTGNNEGNLIDPAFACVSLKNMQPEAAETDFMSFIGSYDPVSLEANDRTVLYLGIDNNLYYPAVNIQVNACRAVFNLIGIKAGDIDGVRLSTEGGEETAIYNIMVSDSSNSQLFNSGYYTLDGRRLNARPTAPGIYVQNRRKVVVR